MEYLKRARLSPSSSMVWLVGLLLLLCAKILWGYWTRDLTMGDTSGYFEVATRWAYQHRVNFLWSPLYTAYYGAWWHWFPDAVVVTFVHRLILILLSVALVAWLALLTLPRVLALVLIVWWIALPIHYDTLYEVHLFGALPLMLMAVLAFAVPSYWRYPLWLGLTGVTVALVRNEYVIVLVVLFCLLGLSVLRGSAINTFARNRRALLRYCLVFALAASVVWVFYMMSEVQGGAAAEASRQKHTQNMCQAFSFGYQQRHPEWTLSPWLECQGLMKQTFGKAEPTLRDMLTSNPRAVFEHFLWNLSLTPAGLELLLFNETSSETNPDYAPLVVVPVVPRVLLVMFISVGLFGLFRVMTGDKPEHLAARSQIAAMAPILVGAALMTVVVILTQRPRPSYLLGFGVLLMWVWLVLTGALIPALKRFDHTALPLIVLTILIITVPSYASLELPSKSGDISLIYSVTKPYAESLCATEGTLGVDTYWMEIPPYLCAPYFSLRGKIERTEERVVPAVFNMSVLAGESSSDPQRFVAALEQHRVSAVIIDPWLVQKNPGLLSCNALLKAFLSSGWNLLGYRRLDDDHCVAAYRREL